MFSAEVYTNRRSVLKNKVADGVAVFLSNYELPMNYAANTFHFRQDSTFLYYFGIDSPGIAAVIDFNSGAEILFADELEIEDIIWMGRQQTFKEKAELAGIKDVKPLSKLSDYFQKVKNQSRQIHFITPYQAENQLYLMDLIGLTRTELAKNQSLELIKAVIAQRSVKSAEEITEIEKAVEITRKMHLTAMQMASPGLIEQEIAGTIEGIALKEGAGVSFPVIFSVHPEILHNHLHINQMKDGDLLVNDSGAASNLNYAADITRTFPVNGKYTLQQREIYELVLKGQLTAIEQIKPGVSYKEIHLSVAQTMAEGLKELGLMKGEISEAVNAGAHALFFPHGLGHMMGLDVHDMENLGENLVGYDKTIKRSDQFGLAYLRLGKKLQPGYVLTAEPGLYFIPELIQQWKSAKKFENFIEYKNIDKYLDFGGVRIEDDVLVTDDSCRILGTPIAKTVSEVEEACNAAK